MPQADATSLCHHIDDLAILPAGGVVWACPCAMQCAKQWMGRCGVGNTHSSVHSSRCWIFHGELAKASIIFSRRHDSACHVDTNGPILIFTHFKKILIFIHVKQEGNQVVWGSQDG